MPDPDYALTSDSFDFEKLFDAPEGEPLPSDGPNDDRTDMALGSRLRAYRQADDLNWLLDGTRTPANSLQEQRAPKALEDGTRDLPGLAGAGAKDVGMGATEAPRQIVGGMRDAVQSIVDMGKMADEWRSLGGITFTDEQGNFSLDYKSPSEWRALTEGGQVTEPDLPTVGAPSTTTGGAVRAISQFHVS